MNNDTTFEGGNSNVFCLDTSFPMITTFPYSYQSPKTKPEVISQKSEINIQNRRHWRHDLRTFA